MLDRLEEIFASNCEAERATAQSRVKLCESMKYLAFLHPERSLSGAMTDADKLRSCQHVPQRPAISLQYGGR